MGARRFIRSILSACMVLGALVFFPCLGFGADDTKDVAKVAEPNCTRSRSFWERALSSVPQRYCDLVHRAQARLYSEPKISSELAGRALTLIKKGRFAALVSAQAAFIQGNEQRAKLVFDDVLGAREVEARGAAVTPSAMLFAARTALKSGDYLAAIARYRWVVLRLQEVPSPQEQAKILIEAATAAAYSGPAAGRESRAYLSAAESKNAPLLYPLIRAASALSLHRDGDRERAARKSASFESSWQVHWMFEKAAGLRGVPGETLPLLPAGEASAMAAAIAEAIEPKAASIHWAAFLESRPEKTPAHILKEVPEK